MLTVWRSKDKTTEKLSRAALAAEVFLQITPAGAHALCAKLELVNRPEESRRHEWERKNGASSVFSSELIISNIHWLKRNYVRHTEMLSCLSFSSCTALGIAFYAYWIETDHELYSKCWWNIFVMCHCRGGYTSMSIDAVVDLYLFVCVFFFSFFFKAKQLLSLASWSSQTTISATVISSRCDGGFHLPGKVRGFAKRREPTGERDLVSVLSLFVNCVCGYCYSSRFPQRLVLVSDKLITLCCLGGLRVAWCAFFSLELQMDEWMSRFADSVVSLIESLPLYDCLCRFL